MRRSNDLEKGTIRAEPMGIAPPIAYTIKLPRDPSNRASFCYSRYFTRAERRVRQTETSFYLTRYADVNESGRRVYSCPASHDAARTRALTHSRAHRTLPRSVARELKFIGGRPPSRSGAAVATNRKKSRNSHCSSTYRVSPRNMIFARLTADARAFSLTMRIHAARNA